MSKVELLSDDDYEEMGAVGRFDSFDDEETFARAVCGEILEAYGYVEADDVEVKFVRKNPSPPDRRKDYRWFLADGEEGQRGSYKAYVVYFDN